MPAASSSAEVILDCDLYYGMGWDDKGGVRQAARLDALKACLIELDGWLVKR